MLLAWMLVPGTVSAFEVFDATVYSGHPATSQTGIARIPIVDTHQLWGGKEGRSVPARAVLQNAFGEISGSGPVVIDIEHWDTTGPEVEATIRKFEALISSVRAVRPGIKIGLYSTVPRRDYWRAIGALGPEKHEEWVEENSRLRRIAELVDIVFPCAYTFYPDEPGWRKYAAAQVEEARRLAPGKPVYLFLWPEYHDSTPRRGTFLAPSFWRAQLEFACDMADGVVIWGGWDFARNTPRQWDSEAGWWAETQAFIAQSRECRGLSR